MILTIKAILDTVKQGISAYETQLKTQTTTEVVREKKQLKRASNITEQILLLVDKYVNSFTQDDQVLYRKLKRKFLKVN